MYIRAERDSNYALHCALHCLTRMVPYFFAAGHWNYARYLSWHVLEFRSQIDQDILTSFDMGQHTCRHRSGTWNGVFSDQFGEQTYIRQGKAKGGLVGMTLSPELVARWILSFHVCNSVSVTLDQMFLDLEHDEYDVKRDIHKEEGLQRRKLDAADRAKIQKELAKYPHPLKQGESNDLLNIVNGHVADSKVNVDNALTIGEGMAAEFRGGLPNGFYDPISSKVITMETMKKGVKIGNKNMYDMEKLYGRLLVLSQKRDVTLENVLSYELSPVPSALFDEFGNLRKSNKSQLLHKLAVLKEGPSSVPDIQIVDGNEILYQIQWPKIATVKHLLNNFVESVMKDHPVVVVFDQYFEGSIKTQERIRRQGSTLCPKYSLTMETNLPPKESVLKSVHNKRELIRVFCSGNESRTVEMVGEENCIYQHEEADCNIISYVKSCITDGYNHVEVVADDTDIFVLLVYFCWKWNKPAQITMRKSNGSIIDINATATQLGNKSCQVLAVHAITGCDSVSYLFGKGKASAVSLLKKQECGQLEAIGDITASLEDVLSAGYEFVGFMYKGKHCYSSMNQLRHDIFISKKDTPKIKTLPPTDAALEHHIKRAHLQTMLWKASDQLKPPDVNIQEFGWFIEDSIPKPSTGVSKVAPPELMKVVACGCTTSCVRKNCSCQAAGLSCTSFCKCMAQENCSNPHTKHADTDDTESEDSDME